MIFFLFSTHAILASSQLWEVMYIGQSLTNGIMMFSMATLVTIFCRRVALRCKTLKIAWIWMKFLRWERVKMLTHWLGTYIWENKKHRSRLYIIPILFQIDFECNFVGAQENIIIAKDLKKKSSIFFFLINVPQF